MDKNDLAKITETTRCLGFHQVKGGYKEVDYLRNSQEEPVLSLPDCLGPIQLESHHLFMIVFTSSLSECLVDICNDVNTELCRIVKEQFSENTTVSGVAQSVVDKVVRMHREHFEIKVDDNVELRREDISLLVRNFNAKLSNAQKRRSGANLNDLDTFDAVSSLSNVETPKPVIPPTTSAATRSSTTTTSSADTFVKSTGGRKWKNQSLRRFFSFSQSVAISQRRYAKREKINMYSFVK